MAWGQSFSRKQSGGGRASGYLGGKARGTVGWSNLFNEPAGRSPQTPLWSRQPGSPSPKTPFRPYRGGGLTGYSFPGTTFEPQPRGGGGGGSMGSNFPGLWVQESQAARPDLEQFKTLTGYDLDKLFAQRDYIPQQRGFAERGYGLGMEGIAAQSANLGQERGFQNEMFGSQGRVFGLEEEQIGHEEDIERRDWYGDVAARGAMGAPGTAKGFADIQQRATRERGFLGEKRTQADVKHRQAVAGFDLLEKQYGINQKQLKLGLDQALAELNLKGVLNSTDIAAAMFSQDAGVQNWARSVLETVVTKMGAGQTAPRPWWQFGG